MRTTKWVTVSAVVLMVLGFIGSASAQQHTKKFTLYLGTSDTGVTTPVGTALSGVTDPMVIYNGGDYKRRDTDTTLKGLATMPSGNAMLYIDTVTVSQAQAGIGGDYTGNTFFVCAKFGHAGSNFTLLEKIPLTPLDLALSGNTAHGIPFQIPAGTEEAQFFFGPSGVTAYGHFKGSLIVGLPTEGFPALSPLKLSETSSAFATTGTTQWWSGTTAYTVLDGCRYVEIQPIGDDINYTTDGTTAPTTSSFEIANGVAVLLTRKEFEKFWMTVGGAATGQVNFKQWNMKP